MTRVILFFVLYLLGAYLADQFIHAPGQVALFWPSSGLAIGFLIRYGLRWIAALVAAIILMHLLISPVPATFLFFSVASNAIGGALAATYVRRKNLPTFISVRSGFVLLRGGMIMAGVSALIGTIASSARYSTNTICPPGFRARTMLASISYGNASSW